MSHTHTNTHALARTHAKGANLIMQSPRGVPWLMSVVV